MTHPSPESRYHIPVPRLLGAHFTHVGDLARLAIDAVDGYVQILVRDAIRRTYVETSDVLECDLDVSGAGGRHNSTGAKLVDTPYVIYAAWNSESAERNGDLCLFATPPATVVNQALILALTGGTFDMWSEPLMCIITGNAPNGFLYPFVETPQHRIILWVDTLEPLTEGKAVADTAIDCSNFVPNIYGTEVEFNWMALDAGIVTNGVRVCINDGAQEQEIINQIACNIATNEKVLDSGRFTAYMIQTPATFLHYVWTAAAPTVGLTLTVKTLKLW